MRSYAHGATPLDDGVETLKRDLCASDLCARLHSGAGVRGQILASRVGRCGTGVVRPATVPARMRAVARSAFVCHAFELSGQGKSSSADSIGSIPVRGRDCDRRQVVDGVERVMW